VSRNLLAFLVNELKTVRVICRNTKCKGSVIEMEIAKLGEKYSDPICPMCGSQLASSSQFNPLVKLSQAIVALSGEDRVQIEFILPENDARISATK
jgi:hypothetical protein